MLYLRYVSFNQDNLTGTIVIFKICKDLDDFGHGPCSAICHSICTSSDVSDMVVTHQTQSLRSQNLDRWGDSSTDNGLQCGFGHRAHMRRVIFCFVLLCFLLFYDSVFNLKVIDIYYRN